MSPDEAEGPVTTVAAAPPWAPPRRARPIWGLHEGDRLAPGLTVLRPLGGGRRYEVHLVWDDRRLAVLVAKLLRPDQAEEPGALRDLRREAEALAALSHPVIVRAFDAVLEPPRPLLLIEHLEGPTLLELVEAGGPLALEQLLPLAMHVAAALHHMAGEGLVHLDVKPENVVMGVPPRLIDLSVARTLERARRARTPIGTDAYMAPEQADPASRPGLIGPPADVFGLAATVQHALTGRKPFPRPPGARASSDKTVRFPQLVRGPEPLPRRVPRELAALLARAMDPDPLARPAAGELAAGLEPLVARLPRKMVLGHRARR